MILNKITSPLDQRGFIQGRTKSQGLKSPAKWFSLTIPGTIGLRVQRIAGLTSGYDGTQQVNGVFSLKKLRK
jgi:hypothetical protein